ncbi:MAG: hypothetical protein OEL87_00840 [Nanoarchaeota archaeon]|nr:hypothetical protein [Nanoarchaeota archaeon]
MNKRGLFGTITIVGILLVVGFFWFVAQYNSQDKIDSVKCVKVQTTCCPCNMGGQEKCVLESEARDYEINSSECLENKACVAMFNCQIESCEYIDGECVAV